VPLDQRGKTLGSGRILGPTLTRPSRRRRGMEILTQDVIAQHFRGVRVEHVIGLHTTRACLTNRAAAIGESASCIGASNHG
jgi:hypothetical protein